MQNWTHLNIGSLEYITFSGHLLKIYEYIFLSLFFHQGAVSLSIEYAWFASFYICIMTSKHCNKTIDNSIFIGQCIDRQFINQ